MNSFAGSTYLSSITFWVKPLNLFYSTFFTPVATVLVVFKSLFAYEMIFRYESFQLVSFKVKLHFHVKTNIKFFTVLIPLEYDKLF